MDKVKKWVNCQLGDVLTVKNGYAFKSTEYQNEGIPIIRISDIKDGVVEVFNSKCIPQNHEFDTYEVESGDILIAMSGATTGKFGIYIGNDKAYQNQRVGNLKLISEKLIDKQFIYFFLHSLKRNIEKEAYGGAQPNISSSRIEQLEISLPPLNEQQRIVAKIEALFSELDKGIESFKTAREQLKIYRQALLKHTFSGKLTEQWRLENPDKLETAEALLQRIQTEREQRYQQQLEDWEKSPSIPLLQRGKPSSSKQEISSIAEPIPPFVKGGLGGIPKPKPPKTFPPLTAEELAELPELPEGWSWGKLGYLTCSVEYGTSAKSSEFGTCPVLRMGNIQNGKFDWNDLVFTSDESEIEKYFLRHRDVLFNRTNSPELVGKSAIYKSEQPAIFAGYLIRVNQIDTIANAQYLNMFLNSLIAKQHGNKVKTDGVNQSNINGEKLINYPFPYCSIDEQAIIVELLESRLSIIEQMEQTLIIALQQAEALRQSILKKAFSGQLVPQDPNDEPASVLLERIQAEKAALHVRKTKR